MKKSIVSCKRGDRSNHTFYNESTPVLNFPLLPSFGSYLTPFCHEHFLIIPLHIAGFTRIIFLPHLEKECQPYFGKNVKNEYFYLFSCSGYEEGIRWKEIEQKLAAERLNKSLDQTFSKGGWHPQPIIAEECIFGAGKSDIQFVVP